MTKAKFDATELIALSAELPLVHVDREHYLRTQFDKYCGDELLERVIEVGPAAAGIPKKTIQLIAKSAISHETAMVTLISTAAGMPGGWGIAATIPADMVNFHGALIRIAQKLAYIHGWPELFEGKGKNIDDETRSLLLVFLGVMYGVAGAVGLMEKISVSAGQATAKTLLASALTKGTVFPVVKKIATALGYKLSTAAFSKGVGGIVPILGGLVSGAITFASFNPMAKRLNVHLSKRQASKARASKK
jgi:hypothetical protein